MPALLGIGHHLLPEEINSETKVLQKAAPNADLRILEGISIPLCIARKVSFKRLILTEVARPTSDYNRENYVLQ